MSSSGFLLAYLSAYLVFLVVSFSIGALVIFAVLAIGAYGGMLELINFGRRVFVGRSSRRRYDTETNMKNQTVVSGGALPRDCQLSTEQIESAYGRWSKIYDLVFRPILRPGHKAAAQAINRLAPARVLDIGVGTGLELPLFGSEVKLTGIDLSAPMLEVARRRVARLALDQIESLQIMDAMNLRFPEGSFDAVVAPYVLTVVPDPARMLDECLRVLKPGGELVIVNHIAADAGVIRSIENRLGKHADKLGWNPLFPWSIVGTWLDKHPEVRLLERRRLSPLGIFVLMRIRYTP